MQEAQQRGHANDYYQLTVVQTITDTEVNRLEDVTVALSPDGKTLITRRKRDYSVNVWDVETGGLLYTMSDDDDHFGCFLAVSPDGESFAHGSYSGSLMVYDLRSGNLLYSYLKTNNACPDGKALVRSDGRNDVWNVYTHQFLYTLAEDMTLSSDGNLIFDWGIAKDHLRGQQDFLRTGTYQTVREADKPPKNKAIQVYSARTMKSLLILPFTSRTSGSGRSVNSYPVISPDERLIAYGYSDGLIEIWSVNTGELLFTLTGQTESVYDLVFGVDGKTLISSGIDDNNSGTTFRLWNISQRRLINKINVNFTPLRLKPPGGAITVISADRKFLFGTINGTKEIKPDVHTHWGKVQVWDLNTGKLLATLSEQLKKITSIAISADGQVIVVGNQDNTIDVLGKESKQATAKRAQSTSIPASTTLEFSKAKKSPAPAVHLPVADDDTQGPFEKALSELTDDDWEKLRDKDRKAGSLPAEITSEEYREMKVAEARIKDQRILKAQEHL